jgi:AcrR family transcriptional regulator
MTGKSDSSKSPGEGTRNRIIETARKIIEEKGVAGLHIRDLARKVGIREGSIYNHFSSREEIIKDIFRGIDAGLSPLGAIVDLRSTPREQLDQLGKSIRERGFPDFLRESAQYLIRYFKENRNSLALLRTVISERFHDASARAAYEEVFRKDMTRASSAICAIAHEQGLIKSAIQPEALTGLIVAVFEYAIGQSAGRKGTEIFGSVVNDLLGLVGMLAVKEEK